MRRESVHTAASSWNQPGDHQIGDLGPYPEVCESTKPVAGGGKRNES